MSDSSDVKRQNPHHSTMTYESSMDKRLSSMPTENLEHQNISYLGKFIVAYIYIF